MTDARPAISFGLIKAALTSVHVPDLFSGQGTHNPALRLVAQLVRETRDVAVITRIIQACLPENYGGNTLAEVPRMVADAIGKGYADRVGSDDEDLKVSQICLGQVANAGIELFHDELREGYIAVPQEGGGKLCYAVRSGDTKTWLQFVYFRSTNKPIPNHSLVEVVDTLDARAKFESPMEEIHLRVGGVKDQVFVDLGRADGRVVQIGAEGWALTTDCPIRFYRAPALGQLPEPQPGGDLRALQALLGLDETNWVLFLAFLLNCLKPDGPYMFLLVEGEQGSGKSLLCTIIKRVLDPTFVDKLRLPKTEHDLMIQAAQNHVLVFDNASSMKWDMSDALCSLATGSGFSTRKYYTDNEARSFRFSRPVVINGIGEFANRPDLLERSIQLKLPTMPVDARKTERQLQAAFDQMLPGLLGVLFDIVASALKSRSSTEAPKTLRMADTAQWLAAAEAAAGLAPGTFLAALVAGQTDMLVERAVNDPLVMHLIKVVEGQGRADGKCKTLETTVGQLLQRLQIEAGPFDRHMPTTATYLSNALKRLRPALTKIGIAVELGKKTRKGKIVRITLEDEDVRVPRLPFSF